MGQSDDDEQERGNECGERDPDSTRRRCFRLRLLLALGRISAVERAADIVEQVGEWIEDFAFHERPSCLIGQA
jgi:hypothetical protein